MEISKNFFGKTKSCSNVYEYKLINDSGSSVSILNYGGIITEICMPDKNGSIENIVLGLETIEDYEEKSPFFGCITGRIAGRIANATFTIDGQVYRLSRNDRNANLHGGPLGFDKKIWNVKKLFHSDYVGLTMTYVSIDGDQGFPGNLNVETSYRFYQNNILEISYEATTDKKTIVSLTNHSYFNLSGNYKTNILDHKLSINADKYILIDKEAIPTSINDVSNTAFDFRHGKLIKQNIFDNSPQLRNGTGYDHPFILNKSATQQIVLEEPQSGRVLEIKTDQPVVILYTGNYLGTEMVLRGGKASDNRIGVALETQWYPNAINNNSFPINILYPGEKYTAHTSYCFRTIR